MTGETYRERRIRSFLKLADEEYNAADQLLPTNERQAAYFQQQVVEKLVRAVLEAEDIMAGPTHNIQTLADLLSKDHDLHSRFTAFHDLSSAATRYRYPNGSGRLVDPDRKEMERVQGEMKRLIEDTARFLRDKGYAT